RPKRLNIYETIKKWILMKKQIRPRQSSLTLAIAAALLWVVCSSVSFADIDDRSVTRWCLWDYPPGQPPRIIMPAYRSVTFTVDTSITNLSQVSGARSSIQDMANKWAVQV